MRRKAITSAGKTLNSDFIAPLINFLSDKKFRDKARESLICYNTPIITIFLSAVEQRTTSIKALRYLPSVMENFNSQRSIEALFELLNDVDLSIRIEAVRSLKNLKGSFPELIFNIKKIDRHILKEGGVYLNTLSAMYTQIIINYRRKQKKSPKEHSTREEKMRRELIDLLEKRLVINLELIFGLLGLKYPSEEISFVYNGIHSSNPELQTNAIEFLDNLLESDLKRILIPVVETIVLDSNSEDALRSLRLSIPDEKECFEILLEGNDQQIKIAVLHLIAQLDNKKYVPIIEEYSKSENITISTLATETINKISKI